MTPIILDPLAASEGDSIHLVRRDEQDQYVTLLSLSDSTSIYALRDTFRPVLGARQATIAIGESRRGGGLQVAERREVASVGGTFMVKGSTSDAALSTAETLLGQADSAARERYLWWQPDGATKVSLYPLIGPATVSVNYSWASFVSGFFPIDASWPCQPWAEGLVQDMSDDFRNRDAASALAQFQADYETTVTPTSVAQGALELPADLTATQARIRRLDREPWQDGWVTVKGKAKAGATTSERALSPGLRYSLGSGGYFFAQLTGGFLRVREFDGASTFNRASVTQAAPAVGTSHWLRIRAEGQKITAEYWTSEPTPHGTPTSTITYDNASTLRSGYPQLMSDPMSAGAANIPIIESLRVQPYSWRLQNTPTVIATEALPGTMHAAADMDLTTASTDLDYPRHLALAWRRKLAGTAALSGAKSLLIEGEDGLAADDSPIGTVTDTTLYRGPLGKAARFTLTNADASASADYRIDPTIFEPDDFEDACTIAVIVRYRRSSTAIISPRMRAELRAGTGAVDRLLGYAPEFGTTGRYLPLLASGMRTTMLGTLMLPCKVPETVDLRLTLFWSVGTTAGVTVDIDTVEIVPVARLALSAVGKPRDDGTYTAAFPALETTRRVHTDLSGAVGLSPGRLQRYPLNMGGAQLHLPSDNEGVELLVRPAVGIPDDPIDTISDILAHNMTVHLRVAPRYHLFAA